MIGIYIHGSMAHLDWYHKDPDDYCQKMCGLNPDLAAHFMNIRYNGQIFVDQDIAALFCSYMLEYIT